MLTCVVVAVIRIDGAILIFADRQQHSQDIDEQANFIFLFCDQVMLGHQ